MSAQPMSDDFLPSGYEVPTRARKAVAKVVALPQIAMALDPCADCGATISDGRCCQVPGGAICDGCTLKALVRLDKLAHAAGRAGEMYARRVKSEHRYRRAVSLGSQWITLKKRLRAAL